MMQELLAFMALGTGHILDPGGADHLLFLAVLAAGYTMRDWRPALAVVTAFTVGHSLSLALTVTDLLRIPAGLVEFLIPLTIVLAGVETIARGRTTPVLAGLFGLVHGSGFANYLRSLFTGDIGMPLLGFNLGIELAQVIVLLGCALAFGAVDRVVAFRVRSVAVSAAVALAAAAMAAGRMPWS